MVAKNALPRFVQHLLTYLIFYPLLLYIPIHSFVSGAILNRYSASIVSLTPFFILKLSVPLPCSVVKPLIELAHYV